MGFTVEAIVLDFSVLGCVFLFLVRGWHRGVIRPIMNFFVGLTSATVSGIFSFKISSHVRETLIKWLLIEKLKVANFVSDISYLPKNILSLIKIFGINNYEISKVIGRENSAELIFNIMSPFLTNAIRLTIGSIIFSVIMLVSKQIFKSLKILPSYRITSKFNSAMGACFGTLKGVAFIWFIILFFKVILIYWNNPPWIFSQNTIYSTNIFVKFYEFNPLGNEFLEGRLFFHGMDILKCLMKKR